MADLNLVNLTNVQNKKYKFLISKKFETQADVTERTIEVADAFGLGIDDEQKFIIFDNYNFGFNEGDIVYITGDSGSGKSLLLSCIMEKLDENEYIHEKFLNINPEETLIEGVGQDMKTALSILSTVGLNDAFLYLRKYKQLSDGQKLRYKLAKMINSNKKIFIFDEFCATLDRETAKIIAFNMQKYVRKNNKVLIVATTHTDLKEDLFPNVYIYKKFNDDILTEYNETKTDNKCSVYKSGKLETVELKSLKEIEDLEKFHYRGGTSQYKRIIGLKLNNELVGCVVVANPMLSLKGRNIYLNNKFAKRTHDTMVLMNKEVEVLSRVIVHPKYRGIGLSYYLIERYLKNYTKSRYVETIAVMAKYNPFFEKAGMTLIDTSGRDDEKYERIIQEILSLGFDRNFLKSWKYVKNKYLSLDNNSKIKFNEAYKKLYQGYKATHGSGCIPFDELLNKEEFFRYFKKCIRGDIQYLIYDNSEKYLKEQENKKQSTLF